MSKNINLNLNVDGLYGIDSPYFRIRVDPYVSLGLEKGFLEGCKGQQGYTFKEILSYLLALSDVYFALYHFDNTADEAFKKQIEAWLLNIESLENLCLLTEDVAMCKSLKDTIIEKYDPGRDIEYTSYEE